MNSTRTTENHLTETAESLNIVMLIYADIQDLKISHKERALKFVQGTLADAQHITDIIQSRLHTRVVLRWRADYWYTTPVHELINVAPPSVHLEECWVSAINVFLRHQTTWDDAEEAEEIYGNEVDDDIGEIDAADDDEVYNML